MMWIDSRGGGGVIRPELVSSIKRNTDDDTFMSYYIIPLLLNFKTDSSAIFYCVHSYSIVIHQTRTLFSVLPYVC